MKARSFAGLFRAARAPALLLGAACLPSCDAAPRIDLERMIHQKRVDTWEAAEPFPGELVSRTPPEGTVASGARTDTDPLLFDGYSDGRYAERIPLEVTLPLLRRGRARFDVYCAPCHGVRGDGASQVAENMTLRKPPSLLHPTVRAMPPGRIYRTIVEGYGLMRSYAGDLELSDRWAVVAYLRALQLSQHVPLGELPDDVKRRAMEALR